MQIENQNQEQLQKSQIQDIGNFQIDASVLLKEFECSICFCSIEDCYVTRCGHVFCRECILEAINRHHRCPFCQTEINKDDTFKNYHFNNIKKIILDQVQKKQEEYLQNIYQQNPQQEIQNLNLDSPLEAYFRKYLSQMILNYRNKFSQTQQNFIQAEKLYQNNYDLQVQQLIQDHDMIDEQVNNQLNNIAQQLKLQKESLQKQVDIVNNFYLESLEKSLKNALPDPSLLDVRVSVQIPKKNVNIDQLLLKQNDFIKSFSDFLENYFLKKNDPIQDIQKVLQSVILISVPLEYIKLFQQRVLTQCLEENIQYDEINELINQIFNYDNRVSVKKLATDELFINMKLEQGSCIFVFGDIITQSNIPAKCITYKFQKDNEIKLDYFSCKDCNINWVCPGCKDTCHKGHVIQPYVQNHNVTWACCYCVSKTNKCKAMNKFTQ